MRFSITDPVSKRTVTVEGDSEPTQADADQIFQEAGLKAAPKVNTPSEAPKQEEGKYGWLPAVMGTGGNILGTIGGGLLGGAGGTLAAPGAGTVIGGIGGARLGGIAGSAAGQGLGEAINELLSGQSLDAGKIGSETAQGSIYGMLPGGAMTKNIASPLIKLVGQGAERFLGGSLVGGGTQMIRNVQEGKPLTQDVVGQGVATGGINAVLPGVSKLVSGPMKYAGKIIPQDLAEVLVKKPAEKTAQILRSVQEKMVGFKNVDFALQAGILRPNEALTNEHLFSALGRADSLLKQKEDLLQKILGAENIQVPYKDIFPKLKEVIKASPPSKDIPNLQQFESWLENQVLQDAQKTGNFNAPAAIEDLMSGKYPVSLSTINQIKRTLGEYYNESPLQRKLYYTIKNYIEEASGIPQGVKTINKEMSNLLDIKDNLLKIKEGGAVPKQFTPEAIEEAVAKIRESSPKSLHTAVALGSTVGGSALGAIGGGILGIPQLGAGGGLAGGVLGYFKLMQMLSSPGAKEALQKILSGTAGKTYDAGTKLRINQALEQLGVRIPGLTQ